ncbi:MAG: hypothetical protein ACLPUG_01450 [Acidimicrobiales bacterium]|jgi:hypothetical protein
MNDLPDGDTLGLERALEVLEAEAIAFQEAVSSAARVAKKARTAAETGTVRDIPQTLAAAAQLATDVAAAAERLRTAWRFDVEDWFASGEYAKELLAATAAAGVSAFESDERILCYPVIVQVLSGDTSVVIDKKKDRRIRPSVVAAALGRLQQREPKFKPEAFIESLAAAYDLVVASKSMRPGAPVKLVDVHSVLTIMPGTAREYTRPEFARDVYLLDQSHIVVTKKGRRIGLPASALTRSAGVLRTVTRNGQAKDYAGICFEEVGE